MLFIIWVRSFSKMSPYVKLVEDKVIVFVVLREKCENSETPKSNPYFHSRLIR